MNTAAIQHLRTPGFHLGTWLSLGSPALAELAGLCGFDWLLIDLEHGCVGEAVLFQTLQALRGSRSAVIVRIGAPQPDQIQRALDWGADGIMVPHVDTPQAAAACVRGTRFPPHGHRGYSRSVRACDYGLGAHDPAQRPLVFVQIESAQAVTRAREIAVVEGIDVLFIGPADLRFDLQAHNSALDYAESLNTVVQAARVAGIQAGILTRNDADIAPLGRQGFSVLAADSDMAILRKRYAELLALAHPSA